MAQSQDPWAGLDTLAPKADPWGGFDRLAPVQGPDFPLPFQPLMQGASSTGAPTSSGPPGLPAPPPSSGTSLPGALYSGLEDVVRGGELGASSMAGFAGRALARARNVLAPGDTTRAEQQRRIERAGGLGRELQAQAETHPAPTSLPGQIMQGAGGIAPILVGSAIDPALGLAAIGGMAGAGVEDTYNRVRQETGSDVKATEAAVAQIPLEALYLAPVGRLLSGPSGSLVRKAIDGLASGVIGPGSARVLGEIAHEQITKEDAADLGAALKRGLSQAGQEAKVNAPLFMFLSAAAGEHPEPVQKGEQPPPEMQPTVELGGKPKEPMGTMAEAPAERPAAVEAPPQPKPVAQAESSQPEAPVTSEGFPWEGATPTSAVEALADPQWRSELRGMYESGAGQTQRGGQLVTDPFTGERRRTEWAPASEWWTSRPGRMSKAEVASMIDKIEATPEGETPKLTERQSAMAEHMLRNAPQAQTAARSFFEAPEPGTRGMADIFGPRKPLPPRPDELGFYSPIEKALTEKMPEKASAEQVRNIAKQAQPREYEWSGLEDFLKGKLSVTRDEVRKFLRENTVQVQEKELGTSPTAQGAVVPLPNGLYRVQFPGLQDELFATQAQAESRLQNRQFVHGQSSTKFGQYQLPGGENYRELLLTMPEAKLLEPTGEWSQFKAARNLGSRGGGPGMQNTDIWQRRVEPGKYYEIEALRDGGPFAVDSHGIYGDGQVTNAQYRTIEEAKAAVEVKLKGQPLTRGGIRQTPSFTGGHFDEPNILAHVRFNDRVDAQGRKTLFLEEIQSDWAAKGEREGFRRGPEYTTPLDAEYRQLVHKNADARDAGREPDPADVARAKELEAELERADRSKIPDMPFKTREQYAKLALRRMIRYAAEKGYDSVSWTTGDQQAERYDLSKQIRELRVFRHDDGTYDLSATTKEGRLADLASKVSEKSLPDFVGKDLAEKIVRGEGTPDEGAGKWRHFSGLDLKVGGEGMRSFYDKTLPKVANEIGKKWGAKAETTITNVGGGRPTQYENFADWEKAKSEGRTAEVHTLRLPEQMREDVVKKGQPRLGRIDISGKKEPPATDVRTGGLKILDEYLAARQLREQTLDAKGVVYGQDLRAATSGRAEAKLARESFDFYAALKIKGEKAYDAFADQIPAVEKANYDYAKAAPEGVRKVWDQMLADKDASGAEAEAKIPDFKARENYTMQAWKPVEEGQTTGTGKPKFGLSTPREEQRTFPTVLEGLAAGRERAMPDAIANYVRSGKQLGVAIENRGLVDTLKKSGEASNTAQPGMKRVEVGKLFDSAEYQTPEGEAVKVSLPLYASEKVADALNKILGESKLKGLGPVETLQRLNNGYRASIFYTGLFHPRQFVVREMLSTPGVLKNPFKVYRDGLEAIRQWDPMTQQLAKYSRFFNPQDFTPVEKGEAGRIQKALESIPGADAAKQGVADFGAAMRRFTFERLGAAYKLMGERAELAAWATRNAKWLREGRVTMDDGARAVASAYGDLFGGQNWERILLDEKGLTSKAADPTMRDLTGLMLNTPDWTVSKLRLFVKAFENGEAANVRARMWGRTISRAAAATIASNFIMSLFDDETMAERYKDAWSRGWLKVADIDWTPLHNAIFGQDAENPNARHYFGVVGALADPVSWLFQHGKEGTTFDPIKGTLKHLRYRESFIAKLADNAALAQDSLGRAFTGTGELLHAGEPEVYKSKGLGHAKGQEKPSLAGEFNSYHSKYQDVAGPIGYDQMPSYVLGEFLSAMPVQIQAAYAKILGQLDWASFIGRSMGFDLSSPRPAEEPKQPKLPLRGGSHMPRLR